jgi:hypothetical protein
VVLGGGGVTGNVTLMTAFQNALTFYQTNVFVPDCTANPIKIVFDTMATGLGSRCVCVCVCFLLLCVILSFRVKLFVILCSSTALALPSYSAYRTQLAAVGTSANDIAALSGGSIPSQTANPAFPASNNVLLTTAQARSIGFSVSGNPDSTIMVNVAKTNVPGGDGTYDFTSVVHHEINEALGTLALVGKAPGTFSTTGSTDLFRYNALATRYKIEAKSLRK